MSRRLFKDRWYAKRCDDLTALNQLSIDLKPQRSVSDVFINQKLDVTELCKYIEKVKKTNSEVTFFHGFVTAIGKLIYNRNYLNRFVSNRHLFEHNDVVISFVAKVAFNDTSEEVMVMLPIEKNDNLLSVSAKVKERLNKYRKNDNYNDEKKGANSAIDTLAKLPNFLRVPVVGILKWMDRKGILPKSICKDNLYYSSMIVSNLGSLKCGAIFHNINDFGNCSSLGTIGVITEEEVLVDGKKEKRKFCEFGINLDERIADGFYFVKSLHLFQYILNNPKLLEGDADEKIEIE